MENRVITDKSDNLKCIYFQFTEICIQVIPSKDLCFIFKNGLPIYAGNKDALIRILKSI